MPIRPASVAGSFYPGDRAALRQQVDACLAGVDAPGPALATLTPHAGYAYSGRVAGSVFGRVEIPASVLLLCFNHRGRGPRQAIWPGEAWRTPLGDVAVDTGLTSLLSGRIPGLVADTSSFLGEHSGEVQIPFLQIRAPGVLLAAVSLNGGDVPEAGTFGSRLAECLRDRPAPVLVVATTDLSHVGMDYGTPAPEGFTPLSWARHLDRFVLERIAALDLDGFRDVVRDREIPMCGIAPTAAMIAYARGRGAESAEIVAYATSADGDPGADRAVGYPGVIVRPPAGD